MFEPSIEPLVPLPLWSNVPTNPELSLYAEIVFDAVRLIRGKSVVTSNENEAAVRAARYWIEAGNVGMVTFDACCVWLGMDPKRARKAIFFTSLAA